MELILIGLVALLTSSLTFFSGFGLGTILMPVFALFFPVPLAIAATAVVHFANNLFKLALMAKLAHWGVVGRFSLPAIPAAFAGASALHLFDSAPVITHYSVGHRTFEITAIQSLIGILIVVFSLLEFWPRFQLAAFPARWLPLGGVLSGFFGGLSGNQGALRSAFLLKAGLTKEAFIATGIVSAVIIDTTRLLVYGTVVLSGYFQESKELILPVSVATFCASIGVCVGKVLLRRITMRFVQCVVAAAMLIIGSALALGIV